MIIINNITILLMIFVLTINGDMWFWKIDTVTPARVEFHSNLLGGFGVGLFTPINTIDFETVFYNIEQKIIDNVAVWATIIVVVLLYIPCMILSRRVDRKDAFKVWS